MDTVMDFREAYEALKSGKAIKRAGWLGYWVSDGTDVFMHCKDGRKVIMSRGCDPMFILCNCLANDWMVLDDEHRSELDRIHYSRILGEAVAR